MGSRALNGVPTVTNDTAHGMSASRQRILFPGPNGIAVVGFLLCTPMIVLTTDLPDDAAYYYARLTYEFANARWDHAFFPMIPPLVPTIAGTICLVSGLEAYVSLKITSSIFFSLCTIPVYHLAADLWNKRTACIAALLVPFCSRLLRYGGEGLIDPAKTFFFLVMVLAIWRFWRSDNTLKFTILFSLSAAGLTLARTEGVLVAAMGGVFLIGFEITKGWRKYGPSGIWKLPNAFLSIVMTVGLLSPWIAYQWRMLGYPVTDSRQLPIVKGIFDRVGYEAAPGSLEEELAYYELGRQAVGDLGQSILEGMYPLFGVIALVVIVGRLRRRLLSPGEFFLLFWIIFHLLLFVFLWAQGVLVSKRYIIHAIPLYFGWTAIGLINLTQYTQDRLGANGKRILLSCFAVAVLINIWNGNKRALRRFKEKYQVESNRVQEISGWLRTTGRDMVPSTVRPLKSTTMNYHNGRIPIIVTTDNNIIYSSKCDSTKLPVNEPSDEYQMRKLDLDEEELRTICDRKRIHFFIISPEDEGLPRILRKLDNLPNGFAVVSDEWESEGRVIVGYKPNLNVDMDPSSVQ